MNSLLNLLISMISILVAVAFYTILERKILSYMQIRKGPNKVGFFGILQPFSDAIKLFNKNLIPQELMNFSLSFMAPAMTLFLALIIISVIPFFYEPNFDNKYSILLFMVISSLGVYAIMMTGWASNSKYAHMGAIRSMAQMISYEVSFFLIILFLAFLSNSYYFTQFSDSQSFMWFILGNMTIFLLWMISCLAEVNRSPFDFAEGESELVSGFNVEYMGGWFAMIFLAEYSNMIILSFMSVILFFGSLKSLFMLMSIFLMTFIFLWTRGSFPRFRFDLLMYLSWKIMLPSILLIIPFSSLISILSF
uniref:NADH dehydrogenase subunit 1 n=1 Tax=Leucauge wulingensis TaxID=2918496 RepID=UPI001FA7209D|nr:NADH dehydrogenase subunit 1 [Leucauge wulingensis]ULD67703.1 NADH dehydrogenase subunit 1 [Leucauge wulingensis]